MNLDICLGCRTVFEHIGGEQTFIFGKLQLRGSAGSMGETDTPIQNAGDSG